MLQLYKKSLAVAAVTVFFSGLPLILFAFEFLSVPPALWVVAYCIIALPLVVWSALWRIKHVLPVVIWCFAFICISTAWYFIGRQSSLSLEGLQYRFITVGTLLSIMLVLLNTPSLLWARVAVAIWLMSAVALNIYDVLNPLTISFIPGRAAGFYLNPNSSAEALVLGMLLCVTTVNPAWRTSFVLLIGVGVLTTLSRVGILAYGLAVLGLLALRFISFRGLFAAIALASLLAITVAAQSWDVILIGWEEKGIPTTEITDAVEERIAWFTNPSTSDLAMTERVEGADAAWRNFSAHPLIGRGTGTNFDVWGGSDGVGGPGPHNIYLWLIVDHGILGALIFPALLLAVTWDAYGEARKLALIVSLVLLLIGFSSHNLLDSRHVLFSLAVLAAMMVESRVAREGLSRTLAATRYDFKS